MSVKLGWVAIAAVGAIVAPFVFYEVFLMSVLCFALFACAFNLLLGYVGLLSFGHAAFFGFAAYVTGYTSKYWGLTPELGILLGTVTAAAMGFIVGSLAIRRQGIYFAMITLALAQMVYFFCLQAPGFTGGEDGIQAIPRNPLLGFVNLESLLLPNAGVDLGSVMGIGLRNPSLLYFFVLLIFALGFALIFRTIHSPFGQVLKAIRDNEPRAVSLGYRTDQYKVAAFVLSTALAGLAGSTKVLVFQLASLTDVHWSMSGEVVLMTLIGGVGTIVGPVVGAAVIIAIQNYLAQFGAWVTIMQGVIFVACVLLFRKGIVGELTAFLSKARSRSDQLKSTDEPIEVGQPASRPAE